MLSERKDRRALDLVDSQPQTKAHRVRKSLNLALIPNMLLALKPLVPSLFQHSPLKLKP